ncbi:hypothetical protein MPNT_20027 [Candidatus Methylacidithermus pantelleriae]|uniref:Uncharacterized protein n=1 Tax=Candidatus Methylacidithermus pantelleriae TaxID=2744239 RepID=A0A8J2BNB7_9BACT|nr:hypothetical protein MPNT_20027 [Candidatus Methylacidithermus pantelleriae]
MASPEHSGKGHHGLGIAFELPAARTDELFSVLDRVAPSLSGEITLGTRSVDRSGASTKSLAKERASLEMGVSGTRSVLSVSEA